MLTSASPYSNIPTMTMPRSTQISLPDTPWYHLVSRCVRRAYLCGDDHFSGQSYEHRRGWIETRIQELAAIFAIDIAAFAVMSNHYHIVLRVDSERPQHWSDEDVLQRWTQLFTGPMLVQRFLSEEREQMIPSELTKVSEWVDLYRDRLYDISWFMRVLNESIARMANAEDGCTGRFWEGRFKSQALLDEQAVLMAMSYVDLNPIRAGIAETPEQSDHTSIKQRIDTLNKLHCETKNEEVADSGTETTCLSEAVNPQLDVQLHEKCQKTLQLAPLLPFEASCSLDSAIPFAFSDYLELVDYLGRAIHPYKKGAILDTKPQILTRLNINTDTFVDYANNFLKQFGYAVGIPDSMLALATSRQHRCLRGISAARAVFGKENSALAA